jgi:hypothetical protein
MSQLRAPRWGSRLRALSCCAVLLLAPGCLFGGGGGELQEVADPAVLDFADRIEAFYRSIDGIPLDVQVTYDTNELRGYFGSEEEFATYYASLAQQLRNAQVRNSTLERVSILEFRFEPGEQIARVELLLVARHERALRLRSLELARQDTWRRADGKWIVTPDKL